MQEATLLGVQGQPQRPLMRVGCEGKHGHESLLWWVASSRREEGGCRAGIVGEGLL